MKVSFGCGNKLWGARQAAPLRIRGVGMRHLRKTLKIAFLILLVFGLATCGRHSNVDPRDPGSLNLRFAQFDPTKSNPSIPRGFRKIDYSADQKRQYLVQFKGPISDKISALLTENRTNPINYIPNNAFIVEAAPDAIASVRGMSEVRWVGDMIPAYKVEPGLMEKGSFSATNPQKIRIQLQKTGNLDEITAKIVADGIKVIRAEKGQYHDYVEIEVAGDGLSAVQSVAAMPEVRWVEPAPKFEMFNDASRWVIQSNQQGQIPLWDQGLSGTGQIVGTADGGIDMDSCYFYDPSQGMPGGLVNMNQRKVIVYHDWAANGKYDENGHGTHTAGIIAGDRSPNAGQADTYDGMAYNAKLDVQDVFNPKWDGPTDISELFNESYNEGARIHSNSWGSTADYSYTADSEAVDQFMWNNKDFLILFSAGNGGYSKPTVMSPSTAKNLISVGATENAHTGYNPDNVAYFSSHGPSMDGRIKPTLMAPGYYVNSANGDTNINTFNCDEQRMNGTSMSCPTMAGLAALVRQYFTDGFYPSGAPNFNDGFTPSAALIKAVLINGARNLSGSYASGPIPSPGQGWGEVKADDSLAFFGGSHTLAVVDDAVGLTTGQSLTFTYSVDGNKRFRVTLVWTDYPASPSAWMSLVNNLDLIVSGPSGAFLGNVFFGGVSNQGGSPDYLNVEENVYIEAPVPGTYTVTVSAPNVPQGGPQPFALVVTGASRCSSEGKVWLDKDRYNLSGQVKIRLNDCDLNVNPNSPDTAPVAISSNTEPGGETVTLTEIANDSGIFEGAIALDPGSPIPDGILEVSSGDTITVAYADASPAGSRTDTALIAGIAPVISDVRSYPDAAGTTATITWETDEKADAVVFYGTSPALGQVAYNPMAGFSHSVRLTGLETARTYYFDVQSADDVGNIRSDDNGGSHYTFNTGAPAIDVTPANLSVSTYQGSEVERQILIKNQGVGADLSFNISDSLGLGTLLADSFSTTTLDPGKWTNTGANINYIGLNPPSAPYSLNLNGVDTVTSRPFDTTGWLRIAYEYWFERQGAGTAPGSGNNLYFEWWNGASWVTERTHTYADGSTTGFTKVTGYLPSQASINGFRIRFRVSGDPPYQDDWAVDDVSFYAPEASWLLEDPTQGIVGAGGARPITVTFNAHGVEPGSYSANVVIASDDPARGQVIIPTLMTVAPAADISFDSVMIDDDSIGESAGNGDGFIEPLEIVELWVTLANAGGLEATGVSAYLSSDDPNITILDSSDLFGNIPVSSTGTGQNAYLMTVSPLVPDGAEIPFDLTINGGGRQWKSSFAVQATNKSYISGQVTRASGGAPLPNATVHYSGPTNGTETTGMTGAYIVSNLTSGQYRVWVTAAGMIDSQPVTISMPPSRSGVNFALDAATLISGHVTRAEDGAPVSGATITYTGPVIGTTNTDSTGAYIIPNLQSGNYSVRAAANALSPSASVAVTIPPNATGVDFALASLTTISGTVIDQSIGLGHSGANVSYSGPISGTARSGTGGVFSLGQLKSGKYTMRASTPSYNPSSPVTVTVPPGVGGVILNITPFSAISGTVTDLVTGLPVANAVVYYSGPTNGSVISGVGGVFSIPYRPGGTYALYAYKNGYSYSSTVNVTVPPNATGIVLALQPPNIIVSPASLSVIIPPGLTDHRYAQVSNIGPAGLTYSASSGGFSDDMESGGGAWTHGGNLDVWELGAPATIGPSGAHSGIACWGTDLNGNYPDLADFWLKTPPIDMRNFSSARVTFWQWFEFEPGYDYGYVEVQTENSNTWHQLAFYTGYQSLWNNVTLGLDYFVGNVVYLRFHVITDAFINYPGWYIDDVKVYAPGKPNWLTVSPASGYVPPGDFKELDLKFNTGDLSDGAYSTRLDISSNDPNHALVSVPVSLTVTTGASHLSFHSYTVDDDNIGSSAGNGNGFPEAGETVELPVTSSNDGATNLTGITATMTSADPYVTVVVDSQGFGDIAAGESATCLPGFAVSISPVFPYGHTAPLIIQFTDGAGTWQGMINLNIDPVPEISISPSSITVTAREVDVATIGRTINISNMGLAALTYNMRTAGGDAVVTVFQDDMESGENGWSHSVVNAGVTDQWKQSTVRAKSGVKSWNSGTDQGTVGSSALITPPIDLSMLSSATLTFSHWYKFDDCGSKTFEEDGGIVEVSVDGGITWAQVYPGGGYPYLMNDNWCGTVYNPLLLKDVYAHSSVGWEPATFDLNSYAGRVIRIRFRAGWDCGYCAQTEDWYIDDVAVQGTSGSLSWLAINPASGWIAPSSGQDVNALFNPAGLTVGTYRGEVIVESNDMSDTPSSVSVKLIIQPAPKLALNSYTVNDDNSGALANGNDNGVIEPGETVELAAELLNNGQLAAGNVSGTIGSAAPDVTVVNPDASWNDILPGASGTNLNPFAFAVAPDFSGDSAILELAVTAADTGDIYNFTLVLPVARVPGIYVSPLAVSASAPEGATTVRTLTVANNGTADLSTFIIESPNNSWFDFAPTLFVLEPKFAQAVQLSFNASALGVGSYNLSLQVFSNDSGKPVVPVPVTFNVLPASNVTIMSVTVDDDNIGSSLGDGDGHAEQGERIELGIALKNIGSVAALEATALLTSLDNRAGVVVNQADYGDINTGETVTRSDFVVKLDPGIPDGTALPFDLVIATGDGRDFRRSFSLTVTGSYEVTGKITETLSGITIGGAAVNWSKLGGAAGQVTATPTGEYTIPSLPAGDYTLTASKSGYVTKVASLSVPPDHQTLNMALDGPVIDVAPLSLDVSLDLNGSRVSAGTINIADKGAAALNYTLALYDDTGVAALGPDNFGYRFYDTNSPGGPAPGFVDISADGIPVSPALGDDTNAGPMDIGFDFPFYGRIFTKLYVCSNGWISFTDTGAAFGNRVLPDPLAPRNLIAPFWTDLDLTLGGQALYRADSSGMVVEFQNVRGQGGAGPYTFEVVLTPSGAIRFEYLITQAIDTVTIGIQNGAGDDGLTFVDRQPYLTDGASVLIAPGVIWMAASPQSGTVASASNSDVTLSFDLRGLNLSTNEYRGRMAISSNDPEDSPLNVPITLILDNAPPPPPVARNSGGHGSGGCAASAKTEDVSPKLIGALVLCLFVASVLVAFRRKFPKVKRH